MPETDVKTPESWLYAPGARTRQRAARVHHAQQRRPHRHFHRIRPEARTHQPGTHGRRPRRPTLRTHRPVAVPTVPRQKERPRTAPS